MYITYIQFFLKLIKVNVDVFVENIDHQHRFFKCRYIDTLEHQCFKLFAYLYCYGLRLMDDAAENNIT
jgi:hypothetical protein